MITAKQVTKNFGAIKAVDNITTTIQQGSIYGLIGSNGAGKSTFLRMVAGVMQPDSGSVKLDDQIIFEDESIKKRLFYISDEQYFVPNWSADEIKRFYQNFYPKFDQTRYLHLLKAFGLDATRKTKTYSKGMKKQLSIIYAVCSGADYLLCDETFDGLDPVARQSIKSLLASDVQERNLTPILASHNLRELEDVCDHVGLMHRGGVLFSKDLAKMKLGIHKFQAVFRKPMNLEMLKPITSHQTGSLQTLVIEGNKGEILSKLNQLDPLFVEALPLTLEEIFITETEAQGYDIKKLIF